MRLRRTCAVGAVIVAASFAACAGIDAAEPAPLCREVSAISRTHRVPGTFVTVVAPRRELSRCALGAFAATASFRPRHPGYVRIGSITKTFNALAALRLVAAGRLTLRTPCHGSFCPNQPVEGATAAVTLEQLLEHTAGMSDLLPLEMAHNTPLDTDSAFALAPTSRRLRWPPGLYSSYSNNSAAVAARLMEMRSARAYESLVHDFVLAPLGMKSATFARSPGVRRSLPQAFAADGQSPLPYWHMLFPAMGALNLTLNDTVVLLQVFLNRGRHDGKVFLTSEAIARMESPATSLAARHGLTYGYGLGLYQWYRQGVRFYGHDGDADGYRSRFGYAPSLSLGYFIAISSDHRPAMRRLQRTVERSLVGAGAPVPPPVDLDREALAAVIGEYEAVSARFGSDAAPRRLRVAVEGSHLVTIAAGGPPRRLLPLGHGYFRRPGEGGATVVLVSQADITYLLGDDLGNYRRLPLPGALTRR